MLARGRDKETDENQPVTSDLMSRLRFRLKLEGLYLDMHGLIFETSINYWQDQPGQQKEKHLVLAPALGSFGGGGGGRALLSQRRRRLLLLWVVGFIIPGEGGPGGSSAPSLWAPSSASIIYTSVRPTSVSTHAGVGRSDTTRPARSYMGADP